MKKIILVAISALFVLTSSLAFAEDNADSYYVGVLGGYVMPQDFHYKPKSGTPEFDAALTNGYMLGVKTGWRPAFAKKYLATELEYNYISGTDHDTGKRNTQGNVSFTLDGSIKIQALFLNFIARYPDGSFHPYIGIGPGYSWFQLGDLRSSTGATVQGETASQFCWQALAGLQYDITKNWGVDVGYKYLQIKPSFGSDTTGTDNSYQAHTVTMGLNYTF